MLTEFNDDGSIDVRGTGKNLVQMQTDMRDLRLCIRNILVQRFLFGKEDLEALSHSFATILLARKMIQDSMLELTKPAIRHVRNIRDRWDHNGARGILP